jgi:hypothetical protein
MQGSITKSGLPQAMLSVAFFGQTSSDVAVAKLKLPAPTLPPARPPVRCHACGRKKKKGKERGKDSGPERQEHRLVAMQHRGSRVSATDSRTHGLATLLCEILEVLQAMTALPRPRPAWPPQPSTVRCRRLARFSPLTLFPHRVEPTPAPAPSFG